MTIGQNSREKYVKVAELRLIPLEIIWSRLYVTYISIEFIFIMLLSYYKSILAKNISIKSKTRLYAYFFWDPVRVSAYNQYFFLLKIYVYVVNCFLLFFRIFGNKNERSNLFERSSIVWSNTTNSKKSILNLQWAITILIIKTLSPLPILVWNYQKKVNKPKLPKYYLTYEYDVSCNTVGKIGTKIHLTWHNYLDWNCLYIHI